VTSLPVGLDEGLDGTDEGDFPPLELLSRSELLLLDDVDDVLEEDEEDVEVEMGLFEDPEGRA